MRVMATQRGKHGVIRERGDVFEIAAKSAKPAKGSDFSSAWMVDAKSKEAASIAREVGKTGITAEQITSEVIAAGGAAAREAALAADLAALKEENAKMADALAAAVAADGSAKDPEEVEGADNDVAGDAAAPTEPAVVKRRTRRG